MKNSSDPLPLIACFTYQHQVVDHGSERQLFPNEHQTRHVFAAFGCFTTQYCLYYMTIEIFVREKANQEVEPLRRRARR